MWVASNNMGVSIDLFCASQVRGRLCSVASRGELVSETVGPPLGRNAQFGTWLWGSGNSIGSNGMFKNHYLPCFYIKSTHIVVNLPVFLYSARHTADASYILKHLAMPVCCLSDSCGLFLSNFFGALFCVASAMSKSHSAMTFETFQLYITLHLRVIQIYNEAMMKIISLAYKP